jgi:hypothetical protein
MNRTMFSNWLSPNSGPRMVAKLLLLLAADLEAQLLFDGGFGFRGDDILELGAQGLADGAVKLQRLRHAHAVNLDGDDVQAGAGEEINHVAGPAGGETEVLRLDQHQRALRLLTRLIGNDIIQDPAVGVRVAEPRA